MSELEQKIKSGRAALKIISKDINQITQTGFTVKQGKSEFLNTFRAMYPSIEKYKLDYTSKFELLMSLAIEGGKDNLFPTEEDLNNRKETNSWYYKCVEYANALLNVSPSPPPDPSANYSTMMNQSLARSRLPKINVPMFTGNLQEWPLFKQLYMSVIHNNPDIPTVEKFHYLCGALSPKVRTIISAFTISEDNYPKAFQALLDRFDNKRLLASSYIDKISNFPALKDPPSVSSLESFIGVVVENVSAFKSIDIDDPCDFLWLTLALKKLDSHTRELFEASVVSKEWPTFTQLTDFVQDRLKVLQLTPSISSRPNPTLKQSSKTHVLAATQSSGSNPRTSSCSCKSPHPLFSCPTFKGLSPPERRDFLRGKSICYNCLRRGHAVISCNSSSRCRTCSKKHHTLLHESFSQPSNANASSPQPSSQQSPPASGEHPVVASVTGPAQVLLGTAVAHIQASNGILTPVRILVDCGSQFSLITASCAKRLGIPWRATKHTPVGACQTLLPSVKGQLQCTIHSRVFPEHTLDISPLVVGTITGVLPTAPFHLNLNLDVSHLADSSYETPRQVDVLLGADIFMIIVTGKPQILQEGYGILPTVLGDIVMGSSGFPANPTSSTSPCLCLTESPISDEVLTQFWNIEDVTLKPSEIVKDPCEEHFLSTHYRDSSGRYVLALPFKDPPIDLENSKFGALSRLHSLERKFKLDPAFSSKYHDFLSEYESLGHMCSTTEPSAFVIPHHGVLRSHHPAAKLRVVFDGSHSTRNGSLNDKLHVGQKLQKDIADIVINFRRHAIAVTGDLIKMYRQILIRPEDRKFQHILWRSNPADVVNTFALNTVTYGLSSSPFQALRTIKQLVIDEGDRFPMASKTLEEDIFVDDIVSGAETLEQALELKNQLEGLLSQGQFQIHKWASNSSKFLQSLEFRDDFHLSLSPRDTCVTKVLGMSWDPIQDNFFFQIENLSLKTPTKRSILSAISRVFDPVGFLAPVVFQAKHILQTLWRSKVGWDEQPEPSIIQEWNNFAQSLTSLRLIRIPRLVLIPSVEDLGLFGFADASQKGYAAVMYLRVRSTSGAVKVSLLKAKTKLAPLKTLSIPRLELSAAYLLIKLKLSMQPFIDRLNISKIHYFSDSTIVLSWLALSPHTLETFVANRVSYITSHSSVADWSHISSFSNPADVASRGLSPNLLQDYALWWAGPAFLNEYTLNWQQFSCSPAPACDLPELRSSVALTLQVSEDPEPYFYSWMTSHSSYQRLVRSLAYALRFISRLKSKSQAMTYSSLSVDEIQQAENVCIKSVQRHVFRNEFLWDQNRATSKRLLSLSAFLDSDDILRVGGRLQNASLPYDLQHPVILPGSCHLVEILIDHLHHIHFHLGHQALLALVRRKYWIFRLRQTVKCRINKCLTCYRMKAKPGNPLMGNLPGPRVQPSRPFSNVGVDFAGPFYVKTGFRRNSPLTKSYLCVFICLATRAVHLEIVSALSTEAFWASLQRFIARRGLPSSIFSDCGTNFVGAARLLKELYKWWTQRETQDEVQGRSAISGIRWSFNPPSAPHFGGLWEAAVKSAKFHLRRVIGDRAMNFEELATLFARVEAILNSRPLCSSEDPGCDFLTPGHFLIGAPLLSLPEKNLSHLPENHLSRWQLVQRSVQHFWKRWHTEYLHTLHKRPKWYHHQKPLRVGDLVLLSDPHSSPLQWKTARISACHPGSDGVVRVVTIQDSSGQRERPVHKLVSLAHLSESSYSQ